MIRSALLVASVICLMALTGRVIATDAAHSDGRLVIAAKTVNYSVTAEAVRVADAIKLSTRISQIEAGVTTDRSAPTITFKPGQQCFVTAGEQRDGGASPLDLHSGVRIDVISTAGEDQLLMVTTVFEDGKIVWAEAAPVGIAPEVK